jgi:DNA-binding HxlR family transcriptional regulator
MMERHSVVGVLEAIADSKSLEIFRDIAKGTVESEILKKKEGISKKQFYMRTRQMLNTGIIKRVKGKFSLTNFGVVIYHAQLVMEKGVNSFWKLKAIDSIQDSGQIGENERMKLIKRILDDDAIENILVKQR